VKEENTRQDTHQDTHQDKVENKKCEIQNTKGRSYGS